MNSTLGAAALRPRRLLIGSLAGLALLFGATGFAPAQATEATIYTFKGATSDGAWPVGALVADAKGALYGTTSSGGTFSNYGTVFKLTPPPTSGGQWTETVLYQFSGGPDGATPRGSLIFDKQGALYGTTSSGGAPSKAGTVFKLTPPSSGKGSWTQSVLYRFSGAADGAVPKDLIFDSQGALYGATLSGGTSKAGTIFKLTPPSSGKGPWTETVLHNFSNNGTDAAFPIGGLIFDKQGALYGATSGGGTSYAGSVFKLTPPSSGKGPWTETVLHNFSFISGANGYAPSGGLIFDTQGALYGATQFGESSLAGTVFKLTPPSSGQGPWTETLLTAFAGASSKPVGQLLFDAKGDLYGVTSTGSGAGAAGGSVFKLTPPASGKTGTWTLTILHEFSTKAGQGGNTPRAALIVGHDGAFYGTLSEGGSIASGQGAAYRLQP